MTKSTNSLLGRYSMPSSPFLSTESTNLNTTYFITTISQSLLNSIKINHHYSPISLKTFPIRYALLITK